MIKSILVALFISQVFMIKLRTNQVQPTIEGEGIFQAFYNKIVVKNDSSIHPTAHESNMTENAPAASTETHPDGSAHTELPPSTNSTDKLIPTDPKKEKTNETAPSDEKKDKKKKDKKKDEDDDDKDEDGDKKKKDDDKDDEDKKKKKGKKKGKKGKKTNKTSLTFKNNKFELKHCTSYSVDGYFTNFGCYECDSDYQLTSDLFGIGTCKGKKTITNCKAEIQLANDTMTTKCVQCHEGYGTNSTGKECKELNKTQPLIKNCQSYFFDDDESMFCGRCASGYTLSLNGTSCSTACNITNCDNCVELDSAQYCNSCSPGFIGVLGYPFNLINRCITPTDWLKKIFANSILEELL